jgi:succinate dehydrogenase / fumarate reductase, cytochrome b subunit
MANFFTSSIGKKILMAVFGLFLILFLLVHLGINFLLIIFPDRETFTIAAHFMGTNILIKVFEIVLFGAFILHIVYGVIVQIYNWIARPVGYKTKYNSEESIFSKYMFHTAVIILVFLVIHISQFYIRSKFLGGTEEIILNGKTYHDLGLLVVEAFQIPGYVIFYIACIIFLGFHLIHGFYSGFHTLGLNNRKYTPLIKNAALVYTIIVVTGFTLIPLIIYFQNQ